MANVRRGNTWNIDSTGELETANNVKVVAAIVTPTSAGGYIELSETSASSTKKVRLGGATSGDTLMFDLSDTPMIFNGLYVLTVTNAVATLILSDKGRN